MKVFSYLFLVILSYSNLLIAQKINYPTSFITGRKKINFPNSNFSLLPEVTASFNLMQKAAQKDGISIQIVSGYRSFDRQKIIFQKKYNRYKKKGLNRDQILEKITEYSTIPGTSRHHWGTDFDIVQRLNKMPHNLLIPSNYNNNGPFCPMKQWMDENAHKYGFLLVYTNNNNRSGFKYEPWHYSYAPISKKILKQFIIENNKNNILPIIKEAGIIIDKTFYDRYIETHIKGINTSLVNI